MKFLRFWFPVILYSGIIFYVSSLPDLDVSVGLPFFDKLIHIAEYAILGFLFTRAIEYTKNPNAISKKPIIWLTLLFCLLYGASDEFHQSFVVGRESNVFDVIADGIGGLIGSILLFKYVPNKTV